MKNGFAVQKLQPQAESGENSPERKISQLAFATSVDEREYEPASRQSVSEASIVAENGVGILPLIKKNYVVSSREGKPAVDDNEKVENASLSSDPMDVTVDDLDSVPDMDRYLCAKQKDDEDLEKADMTIEGIFFPSSDGATCEQVTVHDGMEKVTQTRTSDRSRFRLLSASIVAASFLYQIVPGKKRQLHKKRSNRSMTKI
jgi:hypothetical protein